MTTTYRRCPCCELTQRTALDPTGVTARVCARCTHHQGDQDAKRLARAETHVELLREKLDACRGSESKAKAAAAEAHEAAEAARQATRSALRSRGQLAARVAGAAAEAGHPCPLQDIASDQRVIEWARRHDEDDLPRYPSGL
jgi:hypothetical protein